MTFVDRIVFARTGTSRRFLLRVSHFIIELLGLVPDIFEWDAREEPGKEREIIDHLIGGELFPDQLLFLIVDPMLDLAENQVILKLHWGKKFDSFELTLTCKSL